MYRPLLEKTKGTNEGKSQVLSRFFHLYQCTSENDFHLYGIFLSYIGASGGTRIKPGFFLYLTLSLSQALGQRVLCCPKRGTSVPPFLEYGKAGPTGLACRLGRPLGNVPPGRSGPAPPLGPWDAGLTCRFGRRRAFATGKLRPTPCKFFEKNLTKNFYLSPPNPSAGFPVSGSQPAPAPLAAFAT
mgnify:CR=1 FL=1